MLHLNDDCVILSDVHYSKNDETILDALDSIKESQIVFNGDIFEVLSYYLKSSISYNKKLIDKINTLSKTKEIIYLEGNHDFNLQSLFANIKVYDISSQPLLCTINNQKLYLSHGDIFMQNIIYSIYSKIIRNPLTLVLLDLCDKLFFNKIILRLIHKQINKNKCKTIHNFKEIIKNKINKYPKEVDCIIEGHYHQAQSFYFDKVQYVNLPAFCCEHKIDKIASLIKKG